jgi:hypothetical protein
VDPCNGKAHVGAAHFPPPSPGTGFTGSGLLCIFEFNITAVPPEGETYDCALYINNPSPDTSLLDSLGEDIPVTKENGYYEIVPEFYPLLILPIFIVITILAITLAKKDTPKSKVDKIQLNK